MSPCIFGQYLNGFGLARSVDADANNLQLKPSFIFPQEDDYPGHALQFDDTTACFNTSDNLVSPSAD